MTTPNTQPAQSPEITALIKGANELQELISQEVPGHRPDLKMKVAQQAGEKALQLTGSLINALAFMDIKLLKLEAKSHG